MNLLKKALKSRTAVELAEELGVTRQAIYRWEEGSLSPGPVVVWKLLRMEHGVNSKLLRAFDDYIDSRDFC